MLLASLRPSVVVLYTVELDYGWKLNGSGVELAKVEVEINESVELNEFTILSRDFNAHVGS